MSENSNEPAGDVQDPAEPKRVETVVETHEAGEEPAQPEPQHTTVETTVTESSDNEG